MSWTLKVARDAQRELDQFLEQDLDGVWRGAMDAIADLREDPFPPGSLELTGSRGYYRIRFYGGLYRMIYYVSTQRHRVIVVRIRIRDQLTYAGF